MKLISVKEYTQKKGISKQAVHDKIKRGTFEYKTQKVARDYILVLTEQEYQQLLTADKKLTKK